MLFLRLDQALEVLEAAVDLRERLVVRYALFNGLSPMEIAEARIEHLDPVECTLFLPRRHWKRNCLVDIDPGTVQLQIVYSEGQKKGPLIRAIRGGHISDNWIWEIVKRVARRTSIPGAEEISPLILKRTFAREFLLTPGNTIGALQRQFSHKHLWSTAHYLRFVLEDVRRNHARMMERVERAKAERPRLVS